MRLLSALQRIINCGGTATKSDNLRKYKPHPVAGFMPVLQLIDNLRIYLGLGIDETLEITGIAHVLILLISIVRVEAKYNNEQGIESMTNFGISRFVGDIIQLNIVNPNAVTRKNGAEFKHVFR